MKKFLSILLAILMLAVMLPVTAMADEGATGDGSQSNPYTLAQFNALTRQQYIDAQNQLGGTIHQIISYPNPHTLTDFKTDATGTFTMPDYLVYGDYLLYEIESPEGYVQAEPFAYSSTNAS